MSKRSSLEGMAVLGLLIVVTWWLIGTTISLVAAGIERLSNKK